VEKENGRDVEKTYQVATAYQQVGIPSLRVAGVDDGTIPFAAA